MTERSYQDAVQVLKDRLGGQWEGVEADGRGEMVSVLKDQLGYDNRRANDTIDAMIESGTLRYHRNTERTGDAEHTGDDATPAVPVLPVAGGVAGGATGLAGTSGGAGLGGVPLAVGMIANIGHWQIGSGEEGESDAPGRAGQVTPR